MIAARDAFVSAANAGLKSAGAHWGAPQPVAAPQAVQAPAPGDSLGVTSGALPKVNTVIGAPPPNVYAPQGLVTIRYKGETRQVPSQLAQQLKAADASVEVLP
jgi:hypothetical protein